MKSGFRSFHPISGLLFYSLAFVCGMLSTHPLPLITGFVCSFIYDIKLRGTKAVSFMLKLVLPFILLSTLINGFFNHHGEIVLFTLPGGDNFTLEAIIYGLVFSLRAGQTLMWLGSWNEVMTNDKVIFLFGRISPRIALLISMALRFIPLITEQSSVISRAQKGIGSAGAAASFTERLKSGAHRLSILVSWTLERGIDTSDSMTARGYGLRGRTSYTAYRFSFKDTIFCALLMTEAAIYALSFGHFNSEYIPEIFIPTPDALMTAASVFYLLIMLLPFIIDVTEEKKWSISV